MKVTYENYSKNDMENKMDKLNMKLTLEVEGKEGLVVTIEYKDTTIETVKLVENAVMQALANINQ